MRKITEKEYKLIKSLENGFYRGVEKYCEELEDTWDFEYYFQKIIAIIDNARRDK
jgi:hypothetical protein